MLYLDRFSLSEEKIKENLRLQVVAKLAPHKLRIPAGWKPRNAFERHLKSLMDRSR